MCDEPHPELIKKMLGHCAKSDLDPAYKIVKSLWNKGYSAEDIITNVFRVCKTHNDLPEFIKLEFIKVIYILIQFEFTFYIARLLIFLKYFFRKLVVLIC